MNFGPGTKRRARRSSTARASGSAYSRMDVEELSAAAALGTDRRHSANRDDTTAPILGRRQARIGGAVSRLCHCSNPTHLAGLGSPSLRVERGGGPPSYPTGRGQLAIRPLLGHHVPMVGAAKMHPWNRRTWMPGPAFMKRWRNCPTSSEKCSTCSGIRTSVSLEAASVLGVSQRTVRRRRLTARQCAIAEAMDGQSPE